MVTLLSPHFSLDELLFSDTATRLGLTNRPDPEALENLTRLAATLEQVRIALGGVPLAISSGYRSPALNQAVGGAPHSAHLRGLAVDFTAPRFGSVLATAKAVAQSAVPFDKIIFEYGRWVHLAIAAASAQPRSELLSVGADHRYVAGLREI
jgi:hypothetical protein